MNIQNILKRNLTIKTVSLILSLMLWFYAATDQTVDIRLRTECNFKNIKDSLAISNINTTKVDILFKGKSRDFLIMNLLRRKPSISINLSTYEKGFHKYPILKESIKIKSFKNISVVNVLYPNDIEFEIDSLREKDILVSPMITGSPYKGYVISGEISVSPQRVKFYGAKKILDSLNSIETEEISIKNKKNKIEKKSKLNIDKFLIKSNINNVIVTIPIDIAKTKEFKSVPVIFLNKQKNIKIKPDSVTVDIEISGPESIISEMLAGEISPMIDISYITKKGLHSVEIIIPKQKYIDIISINPKSIKVEAK